MPPTPLSTWNVLLSRKRCLSACILGHCSVSFSATTCISSILFRNWTVNDSFFPLPLSGPPTLRLCNLTEEKKTEQKKSFRQLVYLLICSSMLMCLVAAGRRKKQETGRKTRWIRYFFAYQNFRHKKWRWPISSINSLDVLWNVQQTGYTSEEMFNVNNTWFDHVKWVPRGLL